MATAREEAERLVAAALAAASFAARSTRRASDDRSGDRGPSLDDLAGLAGMAARLLGSRPATGRDERPAAEPQTGSRHHIATGSAECCLCPVCRAIAAVRDPSPEFAERLASGASDLAAGVTSILRAVSEATRRGAAPGDGETAHRVVEVETSRPAPAAGPQSGYEAGDAEDLEPESEPEPEQEPLPEWSDFRSVWQAATRVQDDRPGTQAKPVAKKAVAKKAVAKKVVAKKAVAKKAVAKKAPPPVATSGIGVAEPADAGTPSAKNSAAGLEPPAAAAPASMPPAMAAGETPAPATARKVAKKTAAKKTAAKKTAAKKTAAKKTAAKKSAAKKTAQKSAGARTTPAKKASGPKKA